MLRDIEHFKNLFNPFKTKSLSFFHLNICSLQKKFGNLHILLNELNINIGTIAPSESIISENVSRLIQIQLSKYYIEHTPNGASALLYITITDSYISLEQSKNVCPW